LVATAIVATNAAARRRLRKALEDADGLEVVTEAETLEELLQADVEPEVVVLGAGPGSIVRVRDVRRALPNAVLVAVDDWKNSQDFRGLLAEGADAVVLREEIEGSLGVTIAAARAGQLVVPRQLRASIAKPSLSTREKQVLGMVVMGFSNGEIARKLVLAESTIKSHLSSAFAKLGVRSRSEASALILDSRSGLGTGILTISGSEETKVG
jgi:DNA-binding NarL/FixJ family response regulator